MFLFHFPENGNALLKKAIFTCLVNHIWEEHSSVQSSSVFPWGPSLRGLHGATDLRANETQRDPQMHQIPFWEVCSRGRLQTSHYFVS